MPRKQSPPPNDAEQSMRFLETASLVEADKAGKAFEAALGILVASKMPTQESSKNGG